MGHHDHERAVIDPCLLGSIHRFVDRDEAARLGEPLARQERGAIVDHHDVPSEHRGGADERDRVVARAADQEPERRVEDLDERADAIGEHAHLRSFFPEERLRRSNGFGIHRGAPEGALGRAFGANDEP